MEKETKKTVSKINGKEKAYNKKSTKKENKQKNSKSRNQKESIQKNNKMNILKKIIYWFKEEFLELKRVSWPSKKVVWKNFVATLVCVLFLGVLFYLIDIIIVWLKTVVI